MSNTFCITFSERYRQYEHPVANVSPDGYVTVQANSKQEAESRAFSVFNAYFCNTVPIEQVVKGDYPLGELYSI